MRLERLEGQTEGTPLGLVYGGVLVLTLAVGALWLGLGLPRPGCAFRSVTGVPCPSCGSTRLVDALVRGDVAGAFLWNPLVFLAGAGVGLWALVALGRHAGLLPPVRVSLGRREGHALRIAAVVALLTGWAWVILRGV